MARERVLVTVKTYPTLSRKYGETVCTAGVRPDGTWVRIYPVPFRRLGETEQYSKYDWLECDLVSARPADPRPESRRPLDVHQLVPVGHVGTEGDWRERRKLLLNTCRVHRRIGDLIAEAKANTASLAIFQPACVLDFIVEPEETREWDKTKVDAMRNMASQGELFEEDAWRETFRLIPKLPYSFSYRFEDAEGKTCKLSVRDWEVGQLYWNCLKGAGGDETVAIQKVRAKYLTAFTKTDLHFYLGTTQQYHSFAPNPWIIVGVLPIPHERQLELF